MSRKDYGFFYKCIRQLLRLVTRRFKIVDMRTMEEKKRGPVVYVSHHQNMFGPVSVLLWFPEYLRTWMLSVFLDFSACYQHYVDFTLTKRLGWNQNVAKIIAYPLAWFATTLTNSGNGIPVYRQSRSIMQTMKQSISALEDGESILIFPDVDYNSDSSEVSDVYEGFLYIEKFYFRKTGKHVPFVPIFSKKDAAEIHVGLPIYFTGEDTFYRERKKIAKAIQQSLNDLANS